MVGFINHPWRTNERLVQDSQAGGSWLGVCAETDEYFLAEVVGVDFLTFRKV